MQLQRGHHQHMMEQNEWFSDKIYWQVADQPGKEGPESLVMVDSVDKEVKNGLSSLNQKRNHEIVPTYHGQEAVSVGL